MYYFLGRESGLSGSSPTFRMKLLLIFLWLNSSKEQQEVSVEQNKNGEWFTKEMGVTEENLPYYKCFRQIICLGIQPRPLLQEHSSVCLSCGYGKKYNKIFIIKLWLKTSLWDNFGYTIALCIALNLVAVMLCVNALIYMQYITEYLIVCFAFLQEV